MKYLTWCAGLALLGTSLALAADAPKAADPAKTVSDEDFVKEASAGGLAEVNFAKLALDQASSADVKKLAQHMLDDHTKANDELNKVADKDKITPAAKMDAKHLELFTRLSGLKGGDFDREYIASQLADHKDAVALFEAESKNGKSDDLKDFAGKTLPTLQHHLEMVQKLAGTDTDKKDKDK